MGRSGGECCVVETLYLKMQRRGQHRNARWEGDEDAEVDRKES